MPSADVQSGRGRPAGVLGGPQFPAAGQSGGAGRGPRPGALGQGQTGQNQPCMRRRLPGPVSTRICAQSNLLFVLLSE